MKVLSLFDGIGCGRLALKRSNVTVTYYGASEIDSHAIDVAKRNHPDIDHIGDVKMISDHPCDLLIGGSPCQSFSPAVSSNTGFDGKSKLFFEYVRIMSQSKPKWFLLENVIMRKEWRDIISDNLGVEPVMMCATWCCRRTGAPPAGTPSITIDHAWHEPGLRPRQRPPQAHRRGQHRRKWSSPGLWPSYRPTGSGRPAPDGTLPDGAQAAGRRAAGTQDDRATRRPLGVRPGPESRPT